MAGLCAAEREALSGGHTSRRTRGRGSHMPSMVPRSRACRPSRPRPAPWEDHALLPLRPSAGPGCPVVAPATCRTAAPEKWLLEGSRLLCDRPARALGPGGPPAQQPRAPCVGSPGSRPFWLDPGLQSPALRQWEALNKLWDPGFVSVSGTLGPAGHGHRGALPGHGRGGLWVDGRWVLGRGN